MTDEERRRQTWDAYWRAYRRRLRRRYAAVMACIMAPIGLLVVAIRLLAPPDYPTGDIRNELAFRLGVGAFFIVVLSSATIGAVRVAWRERGPLEPPHV